ncbi:catechol 2,3-dioxygenase-like lactoylglutathione lyase family enzyme [Ensifer sp. WSM1721]
MRFINPIPFVRDINYSKEFYEKRLGLKILEDFGNFVLFETGFAIHEGTSLEQQFGGKPLSGKSPMAEEICCCILNMKTLTRRSKTLRRT